MASSLRSACGSRIRVMPWLTPRVSRRCPFAVGPAQRAAQALAGADPKLRVHLAQVPLHRAGADVELRTDLRVGETVASEPRDLLFLGREVITGVVSALAHLLTGGEQLASRALGKSVRSHLGEEVIGLAELLAGVDPPVLTPQPLAIGEPGTREVRRRPRLPERLDSRAMQMLGRLTVFEERAHARLCSLRPGRAAGARPYAQLIEGLTRDLVLPAPRGGLDELVQRPRRGPDLVCRGRLLHALEGELVLAEPVVQDGHGVIGNRHRASLAPA